MELDTGSTVPERIPGNLKSLLFPGDIKNLVNAKGSEVASDVLDGQIVGILVGPPWWKTIMVNTILPEISKPCNEISAQGKPLAIIYVPLIRDEDLIEQLTRNLRGSEIDSSPVDECFSSFLENLPAGWFAVPPSNVEAVKELTLACDTRVIGMAFVTADGEVITKQGRDLLIEWGADAYPFSREHIKELEKPIAAIKENPTLKALLTNDGRDYLIKNDGTKVEVSSLEGKPIALYFSAHWCPPCRRFTPLLITAYNELKATGKYFEVVFVSWDKDQDAFEKYFGTMPWLAIPFSDEKGNGLLKRIFDVEGIPSLIILDSEAKTQQNDAVGMIREFGSAAHPFTDDRVQEVEKELQAEKEARAKIGQSLESLLVREERDFVVNQAGEEVKVSSLVGKTVGLYFSGHWCPPCRGFTPKLASIYKELRSTDKPFEIIFISSDRNEEAFKGYFGEMPWLALPYSDRVTKQKLSEHFEIRGIPSLVILGPDGKTVNRDGRAIMEKSGASAFPFAKDHDETIQKTLDDAMAKLQKEVNYAQHAHPLVLMRVPYREESFVCDVCSENGTRWAYRCERCGYDVHTECVKKAMEDKVKEPETTEANGESKAKEGWVCEGDVCKKE